MSFNHPGPMPSEQWPAPDAAMRAQQRPAFQPRPTGVLAKILIGASVTYTALAIARAYWARVASPTWVEAAERGVAPWDAGLTFYDLLGLPTIPALLLALVMTAIWLTNVRRNVDALAPEVRHARSMVWATIGWFFPIVGFWFPMQFVRDVRHASQPDPVKRRIGATAGPLVGGWWFTWLVMIIMIQVVGRIAGASEPSVSAASALDNLEFVNALATTVACVLWVTIVRQIERNQAALITSRD
jgi:hypothetical protein